MAEEKKQGAAGQNIGDILKIRRDKLSVLQEAGQDPFQRTRFEFNCTTARVRAEFDALENTQVRLAGRMMSKRVMGKVTFCAGTNWAKRHTRALRNLTSAISSAWKERCSVRSGARCLCAAKR